MDAELENNRLVCSLVKNFPRLFSEVESKQWLICAPQNVSIEGVVIDLKFVEYHILKPSPFFKDHYITTHLASDVGTLRHDGETVTILEGFPESKEIPVLSEECAYNKDGKPYKILILSEPLVHMQPTVCKKPSDADNNNRILLKTRRALIEQRELLTLFPEASQVLLKLDHQARIFNKNYLIVKGYLQDAIKKLQSIHHDTTEEFLNAVQQESLSSAVFATNISIAIESVLMSSVYPKVFEAVKAEFVKDDQELLNRYPTIRSLKHSTLGIHSDYMCDFTLCVELFRNLPQFTTPIELLYHMNDLLDSLSSTITEHVNSKKSLLIGLNKDAAAVTTDDLIPLLVYVLALSEVPHLYCALMYVEEFHWSTSGADTLGFSLVSLRAAVEYIKSTNFSTAETLTEAKISNVVAFTHLELGVAPTDTQTAPSDPPPTPSSSSYHDLLVPETHFNREEALQESKVRNEKKKLGEFLYSLKNDPVSYWGQQT